MLDRLSCTAKTLFEMVRLGSSRSTNGERGIYKACKATRLHDTRCISHFHTDAAQESPNYGCISSGGATGLDSLLRNAACSDFAPSRDRIDLFQGKVAVEGVVGRTLRHQSFINALTTDSGGGERAVVGVGDEGGTVGESRVGV
jgi:hypothetical protein